MFSSWGCLVLFLVVCKPSSMNSSYELDLPFNSSQQESSSSLPNVIVVGAGLAGLATSLGLANTGKFQVDLVELRQDFSRKGASFGLAPNGMKALEELDPGDDGVMSALRPLAIDTSRGMRRGWLLGWWMIRNALLERVKSKSDKIRLHMGYTVKDIIDDPGTSHLKATFVPSTKSLREERATTIAHHDSAEQLTLEGCLLVGADGVHSSIRHYLQRPQSQSVGVTLWRGSLTIDPSNPGDTDPALHELLLPLLDEGITPLGGIRSFGPTVVLAFNFHSKLPGTLSWTISTKGTDIPSCANVWTAALEPYVDNENDRRILQALLALSNPNDVLYPATYCVVEPPAQNGNGWGGKGRVLLMGDAAHALRAASGQGGNMAFEDAVVLCRALCHLEQSQQIDAGVVEYDRMVELVSRVENERLERVRKVWNMEHLQAEQNYVDSRVNFFTPDYVEWLYQGV